MYAHYLQNPQYPINQFPIKNTRFSKEMKIDNTMASAVVDAVQTGKTHNVTCIMYELGYINDKLEPDYERISDNIQQLDISGSLKSDLLEGVEFCQQFSVSILLGGALSWTPKVGSKQKRLRLYRPKKKIKPQPPSPSVRYF